MASPSQSLLRVVVALIAAFVAALLCAGHARPAYSSDYLEGSLLPGEFAAPYSRDPRDSWNRIFRALFSRNVTLRLTNEYAAGAPFVLVGFPRQQMASKRTFIRHESGDRPIVPLYPSFLSTTGVDALCSEPRFSEFRQAINEALAETSSRSPFHRALMQADVWAAYDMLWARHSAAGVPVRGTEAQSAELLPLLSGLMRKLALTAAEIRGLPNNYAAVPGVPPLFRSESGWIEVEWNPHRSHDTDAGRRTAARVFLKPRMPPADVTAFVNRLRGISEEHVEPAKELESVALITEQLLIASDGTVMRSPIITDVQIRRFINDDKGHFQHPAVEEFELSRQRLGDHPESGGFVHETEAFPAYLPTAGNDYRFASPMFDRSGPKQPVLGTLRSRCISCHGDGLGAIFTFSQIFPSKLPPVRALPVADDVHGAYVVADKMAQPGFRDLVRGWKKDVRP